TLWIRTPARPTDADSTDGPAGFSASWPAFLMALTVESRFTTTPLRSPFDSADPIPTTVSSFPSPSSQMTAHVLVVPTSKPTTYLLFLANFPSAAPFQVGPIITLQFTSLAIFPLAVLITT